MKVRPGLVAIAAVFGLLSTAIAGAQDLQQHVTYVCNGQRLFIENCNIRDLSDAGTCYVGHPDHVLSNGLMAYTTETRATLKKLLPTCKQPSAEEVARAKAFDKKVNDRQAAAEKKANDENDAIEARAQAVITGKKPQTADERTLNRCITSGRLPASCTGNALLGGFTQMLSQVLPSATKEPTPGPTMAGVFEGAGHWRLDFIDGGVLVNCSFLSPDQHSYALEFKSNRTALIIDTTPKPLVLTLRADGTIVGPGPLQIDGVVATGYTKGDNGSSSSGYQDQYGMSLSNSQVAAGAMAYDSSGHRVYSPSTGSAPGHATFSHKRATCPALNLSSKGAGVGVQTMQTDLLKTMFGGDKGPPTPPGIRMHGIFAASTGFSVQFFPESAILGCGPDAARAYPYTVVAEGTKAVIKINSPDQPLTLAFNPDGSLDPGGSGPYQVHGRTITGQNANDDFTFAPLEQTCNLARLTPSKTIPSGSAPATMMASASGAPSGGGHAMSTASAPTGNAVLSVASGFLPQPGVPNPLAGHTYVLLKQSFEAALAQGGFQAPPGMSPVKGYLTACANRQPACQQGMAAANSSTVAGVRADANGKAQLPGLPAGTYYFFCLGGYNKQLYKWDFSVDLKSGANSITLDQHNAVLVN